MNLMRHDQTVIADTKQLAQCQAIRVDVLFLIATITVDIECCITTFTATTVTGAAKGGYVTSHIVKIQLWLYHLL